MKLLKICFLLSALLSSPVIAVAEFQEHPAVTAQAGAAQDEGLRFSCAPGRIAKIETGMEAYLSSLGITADLFVKKVDKQKGVLVYTLNTPESDTNTLNLKDRAELQIQDDIVTLPGERGRLKTIHTVSKKEIVLAMLQHGRPPILKAKPAQ